MAKPPVDADPEKFIIGHGLYDNTQLAVPFHDEHVFRLDPAPMPVRTIVVYNMVFVAFFFGFYWLLKHYAAEHAAPWMIYVAPLGIGLLTCVAFTLYAYLSFKRTQRLGPWLVYEKASGRVELPREKMRFDRDEIVHVQYITTKRLDWGGVLNNERLSELNLVTCSAGQNKRWPLLRSILNVDAFDDLLEPLLAHTDLPVMRLEDEWLGWKVTEQPYGRAISNET